MPKIIQLRRDTKTNWETYNPLLAQGEIGLEVDTGKYKIGDGINNWLNLAYGPFKADENGIIDGGHPDSNYGGIEDINGGVP